MRSSPRLNRNALVVALALSASVGVGGVFAQQSPGSAASSPSAAAPSADTKSSTGVTGSPSRSAALPTRNDSPDDAWTKLGYKGYVTKDDVKALDGFSFDTADTNHDGQLSQDEFRAAWSTYRAPTRSSSDTPMSNPNSSSPTMRQNGSSSTSSPATGNTSPPK